MTGERRYPDEPAGPFEAPPRTIEDAEGRELRLRRFGDATGVAAERDALVAMYDAFDPADRAQGIPPSAESAVREWVDDLLEGDAVNVLAWDGESVAGHAVLVPEPSGEYELAIFVHQEYQGAGVGTALIRALLGAGQAEGIERVWLTVERWNSAAVTLYRGVGFETTNAGSFELEMAARLAGDG
ncbi:MAG: GNAT family N-acetyltransferase [Halobacteriales archaeon]|nr:GNAT family N-acetyltransferase [Halobacteriales archaeon]